MRSVEIEAGRRELELAELTVGAPGVETPVNRRTDVQERSAKIDFQEHGI
jgi:hypothetical protein